MHINNLPHHLQQRLRAELKPGESITWVGQPSPDRFMKDGFKLWLFFIPWTAFSLFWIAAASGFQLSRFDQGWDLFPLFGLPFLLIGLGGLSSPLWLRRKAHSIIYAITNRRAIAIEGTKSIIVKSYLLGDIANIERTEHQDGYGNLILRKEQYRDSDGDKQTRRQGFFAIPDVRLVEHLIESLARTNQE
ncbi:MAG: hypothetical protein K2P84_11380 [Undibacterium sp.]|nr:hypothetical protein [Undibacterium sp.]